MKTFARIEGGVVAELLSVPELPPFHRSLLWVEAAEGVSLGWAYTAGRFEATSPDADQGAVSERVWRDIELNSMVWLRDRHRDQQELGVETPLTDEQFTELLAYMQALRDWPQSDAFPDSSARPVPPAFLETVRGDQ